MAIQQARVTITGIGPLLQNNPQTVDPFNRYKKECTLAYNRAKKSKTEEDLILSGNWDTEAKLFFDAKIGVYVPTRWLTEQIVTSAFGIIKTGKDKMRAGIFATEDKAKLTYDGMNKVKTIHDVVLDPQFRHRMILPQGQIRIAKDFPVFNNWSFSTVIEFDDSVVDLTGLTNILKRSAMYVGFGDFRPTFGRAKAEVSSVE
jgi:hypothetical protein